MRLIDFSFYNVITVKVSNLVLRFKIVLKELITRSNTNVLHLSQIICCSIKIISFYFYKCIFFTINLKNLVDDIFRKCKYNSYFIKKNPLKGENVFHKSSDTLDTFHFEGKITTLLILNILFFDAFLRRKQFLLHLNININSLLKPSI